MTYHLGIYFLFFYYVGKKAHRDENKADTGISLAEPERCTQVNELEADLLPQKKTLTVYRIYRPGFYKAYWIFHIILPYSMMQIVKCIP